METDFRYFRSKYGDAGARDKFENVCTTLLRAIYGTAQQIKANPGDEGIDVFVGDFVNPIEVYQCKFFLDGVGVSQQKQIRESFSSAINSGEYTLSKWYLCIPKVMDIHEQKWWSGWKLKMETKHSIPIILIDGSELLDLLKENNLFNRVFDIEDKLKIEEIYEYLMNKRNCLNEIIYDPIDIDYSESIFIAKLESANINEHKICQKEFYNAEILKSKIESKGFEEEIKSFNTLKDNIQSIWFSQYVGYKNENDGCELLSDTYKRLEDTNSSLLDSNINASLYAKKGILHQLAEKCEVGWVKNYKKKISEYLKPKEGVATDER